MTMENQILLGRIIGPHGLKGEVKIRSFTADPLDVASYGAVTARDGRRFRLERARLQGDVVIAAIRGISDRNAAEALKGLELHVEREGLPEADEGEFYQADLIGLPVFDGKGTKLGEIVGFQDFGAGDLVEVVLPSGALGLVPFVDVMVPTVNVEERRVVLSDDGVAVLHADVELSGKTAGTQ